MCPCNYWEYWCDDSVVTFDREHQTEVTYISHKWYEESKKFGRIAPSIKLAVLRYLYKELCNGQFHFYRCAGTKIINKDIVLRGKCCKWTLKIYSLSCRKSASQVKFGVGIFRPELVSSICHISTRLFGEGQSKIT